MFWPWTTGQPTTRTDNRRQTVHGFGSIAVSVRPSHPEAMTGKYRVPSIRVNEKWALGVKVF
jgi:hypothetical protein